MHNIDLHYLVSYDLDLHDLDSIDESYDIVFTSGVLIHVPPGSVSSAVGQMIRKANRYVTHIEHLGLSELVAGPKEEKPMYKVSGQLQWTVDLDKIYRDLGYDPKIIELPKEVRTNGASELVMVEV